MNTDQRPRILFLSAFDAPFIEEDYEFLQQHFRVARLLGSGILQFFKILLGCLSNDIAFCWFASIYSAFAVFMMSLLRRRSIVVVGGVDAAKEKSLGYGIWLSPWKSWCVRFALRHASAVLPVTESLAEEVKLRAGSDGRNISVVPTGYDATFWHPGTKKGKIVLTVAAVKNEVQLRVKGIDILVEAAAILKEQSFVVLGMDRSLAAHLNPPANLQFVGLVPRAQLLSYYQGANVYCQPSRREGLSNALCEAMLCSCIPVAFAVGGNQAAMGDIGIVVEQTNSKLLAEALLKALALPSECGNAARARIAEMFPRERRQRTLLQHLTSTQA